MANYLQRLLTEGKENLPALVRKLKGQPALEGELVGDLSTVAKKKVIPDIEGELVSQKMLAAPLEQSIAQNVDEVAGQFTPQKRGLMDTIGDLSPGQKAIGAAGLVTAASAPLLMNGENNEDNEISSVSKTPHRAIHEESPKVAKIEQSVAKSQTTGKASVIDNALQTHADEIESSSREEDSFNRRLQEARQKDADQGLMFGLLKASQIGGAALAGSKADTSYADTELAKGDQFVNRLKTDETLTSEHKKQLEEQEKQDPNSKISKLMQQSILALKPGANVQGLSAAQVEKIFPSLAQAMNMKEAIESRKETAQLQREAMLSSKGDKKERDDETARFKVQTSVDKMVNNLRNSDDYKTYQATKAAQAALDNAIATGNKTDTGSAFMLYAKIAQGDNSVVRESDMRNLAGSYNYTSPEDMFSKLAAKASGGNFNESELQQMKKIATLIQNVKAKHVQEQLSPIQSRIEGHKLNPNEIIDPGIMREFSGGVAPKETTIPSGNKIRIIDTTTGKTKTVDASIGVKILQDPRFQEVK